MIAPFSPHVMLSPKATKRVTVSLGGARTETLNAHTSVRCRTSVAVQPTLVVPIGNSDPLAGVQAIDTGGAPLVDVGVPY